jgi:hypothetical protein
MPNTIHLKGTYIQTEGVAGGAITPGMLVQGFSTIVVHAAAAGNARKAFAVEKAIVGEGITDAYASGDQVIYRVYAPGSEVYALLKNGQNVAAGDPLVSAGDGSLQAADPTVATDATDAEVPTDNVVAYAAEALNNSSGAAARLIVEVA